MNKILFATAFFALSSQANANLVVNGSFEDNGPGANKWQVYKNIPGWSTVSGPGIEVRNNVVGLAQDGNQFVELDSHNKSGKANSTMQQKISTTLGSDYLLSFYYSPRINQPSTTNGISVYWNNSLLQNITATGGSVNTWSLYEFVVKGSGIDFLKFAATGKSDTLGGNIDNVQLNAVPAPTALWLFASAVGLFGFSSRRKHI